MGEGSDGREWQEMEKVVMGEREEYSRLAFFYVCLFVATSEGEELIVDIVGRHCEGG